MINKLKEIKNYENPIKKAKIVENARDLIAMCIDDFWKGLDVDSNKLMLDADQLLSIMIYTVIKCKLCELPAHIKLVEEFTSSEVQNSKIG